MIRNFNGFGQAVPATCQDRAQALSAAQSKVAMASGQVGADGGVALAQANQEVTAAAQALQSCMANPPTSTAQDVGTALSIGGALLAPLANLGVGIFNATQRPKVPATNTPIIMQAPAQSNNTPIIIAVVAVVALLITIVMMKK